MIQGIHITATFEPPIPFTDEWLEAVYISVQRNMAVVSADMLVDEDASTITFHLGIDSTLGFTDTFVAEVAGEALDKAFSDAADGFDHEEPVMTSSEVMQFA